MDKKASFNLWYAIAAIVAILLLQYFWLSSRTTDQLAYSEFLSQLDAANVEEVVVTETQVRGKLRQPLPSGAQYFVAHRVEDDLARRLATAGVKVGGDTDQTWVGTLLSWIVPVLFFVGLWYFLMRRVGGGKGGFGGLGGYMEIGRSKARVYMEKQVGVTFEDVAGVDEAKDELKEIIAFLKDPKGYGRLGGRLPKGILLVGPPGTGKTLLARAVAGEAGVPFFSISGSEFVEMFVGVGAARVRDLFEQARGKAPCIIFIDELDALGRARGLGIAGGESEKEQTLNQLLHELDGFDPSTGIVLLGATNRPEILDPALLRAGRFDRQILVDRPDKKGRVQILNVHLKKIEKAADIDPEQIAALTPGFSGADLANLVNEAALLATRRGARSVTLEDFNQAIERIIAGLEKKNRILSPKERRTVAFHEMGHALVALTLPGAEIVHKVSIIPRGIGALGYTIQRPTEDRYLMTKPELENKMAVLLAGRAAERLVFSEVSTGAEDDLSKASDIARAMVTRFGMDESLGQVNYEEAPQAFLGPIARPPTERRYSEETANAIDRAVRALIDGAFQKATRILSERRAILDAGAEALLERETLGQEELKRVFEGEALGAAKASA